MADSKSTDKLRLLTELANHFMERNDMTKVNVELELTWRAIDYDVIVPEVSLKITPRT